MSRGNITRIQTSWPTRLWICEVEVEIDVVVQTEFIVEYSVCSTEKDSLIVVDILWSVLEGLTGNKVSCPCTYYFYEKSEREREYTFEVEDDSDETLCSRG